MEVTSNAYRRWPMEVTSNAYRRWPMEVTSNAYRRWPMEVTRQMRIAADQWKWRQMRTSAASVRTGGRAHGEYSSQRQIRLVFLYVGTCTRVEIQSAGLRCSFVQLTFGFFTVLSVFHSAPFEKLQDAARVNESPDWQVDGKKTIEFSGLLLRYLWCTFAWRWRWESLCDPFRANVWLLSQQSLFSDGWYHTAPRKYACLPCGQLDLTNSRGTFIAGLHVRWTSRLCQETQHLVSVLTYNSVCSSHLLQLK